MEPATAAFFDVDGTIVIGNIVRYGIAIRTAEMSNFRRWLWVAGFLPRVPVLLVLDRISRARFQRFFYRMYRAVPPEALADRAEALFHQHLEPNLLKAAVERIEHHRRRGHRVVLVTGSLDAIVGPLAALIGVKDVIAARLEVNGGRHTGALAEGPYAGPGKAAAIAAFAEHRGIELEQCHAYGDSMDDIPMLGAVGIATVVNADSRLSRISAERGWTSVRWTDTVERG